ncbi:MAG: ABC transporter substrate-binding protein [Clostridiales bacterium]|nr:ABC transporter substrate-binding protein [Clostridiales bacterium]
MKKFGRALALSLSLSLLVSVMSGCGKKETEKETTKESSAQVTDDTEDTAEDTTDGTTAEVTEETEETYEEGYPVELTDIYGYTSVIKAKPQSIVSLSPACTELVYSLGMGGSLVGRTSVCNYPDEVASVESIGDMYAPDVEKIASLEPDIIVTDSSITPEATVTQLRDLGLNVVILNEGTTFEGVYTKIENMGKIFHADDVAAQVIDGMKAELAEVQDAIKDVNLHPSVYYVVGFGDTGDWTATGDTFINDIITMAGGDNIAKDGQYYSYNVEDLVSQDPNIIILPSWADGTFQTTAPYSELTAVKEGNIIVLDSTDTLDRQCARNPEAVRMLAEAFYPECFAEEQAA